MNIRQPRRLIVLGIMGRTPLAGVVWQALHYLEGFRRLGLEVYYVEDTGAWPYDPEANTVSADASYALGLIGKTMAAYGFGDRWAYRDAVRGDTFGMSDAKLRQTYERADALVNLTASTVLRAEHLRVPIRVYLETDPVSPQIEVASGKDATIALLAGHTHHFSYGENLGASDCAVPVERFHYSPTRQPVVLDWWMKSADASSHGTRSATSGSFTTIANWRQSGKDLHWKGELYTWSKHHEFLKFVDLPKRTSQPLELALCLGCRKVADENPRMSANDADAQDAQLLKSLGWQIVDAIPLSKEILPYRDYILRSRGEFTVAKDQNVRLRTGWFSDRSACYLAAGCPVITQDTGFDKFIPTGKGLFAFQTMDEIIAAIEIVNLDYSAHSRAARAIAAECFKAESVLAKLLDAVGL